MTDVNELLRAKDALSGSIKGEPVFVTKGELVHPDSAVAKAYPDNFEPAGRLRHDVPEQATKAPGEKRGGKASKRSSASPPESLETRGLRSGDLHRGAE